MSSAVALRYARAIFELASETDVGEKLVQDISEAARTYESNEELRLALESPLVPLAAKRGIVTDVAERLGLSALAKNTLLLLGDRRRLSILPAIARKLRELSNQKKGLLHAEVITATRLSEAWYGKLQAQLERVTGKRVVLDRREDPNLIAGVVTRVGDTVFDGSLRTRIETLRNSLLPN